eukprot:CAMPEP_0113940956 /NCGR_PEP_ID=MMETSP1339-20121228/6976_1 /TAXON_ID=94617 /ORGANISM="Fibrocapsa japonica" /LENGTH=52 /DNA_ID=CAMNT_0000944955 /DNA_START=249 /DNA_END=404 /DNA_ORIENTATION=- /assembly_acc=CAM_ASM_000762
MCESCNPLVPQQAVVVLAVPAIHLQVDGPPLANQGEAPGPPPRAIGHPEAPA